MSSEPQRRLINPCPNLLPENMQEMNDYGNGVMEIRLNVTAQYPQWCHDNIKGLNQ